MTVEGDVTSFLGIEFTCVNTGGIQMSQLRLIDRVLKATGLQDCNPAHTPASQTLLGTDKKSKDFEEEWRYSTGIIMLLYLALNSQPEITYAIHQCTCFTHNPKASHRNDIMP